MPTLLLRRQILQTHSVEQLATVRAPGGAEGDNTPQQNDGDGQNRAEDLEKQAGKLDAEGHGRDGVDAQREGEAPPAHVEDGAGRVDGGEGEDQPGEAEAPHDEADEDAQHVDDVTRERQVGEERDLGEHGARHFAQVRDGVAAHAERAQRQEARDDDLARR